MLERKLNFKEFKPFKKGNIIISKWLKWKWFFSSFFFSGVGFLFELLLLRKTWVHHLKRIVFSFFAIVFKEEWIINVGVKWKVGAEYGSRKCYNKEPIQGFWAKALWLCPQVGLPNPNPNACPLALLIHFLSLVFESGPILITHVIFLW